MALTVPLGVIFIWTGLASTIPAGWKRTTSLDSKFIKAWNSGVDPGVTGGSDTHTHTSPAHSHYPVAHRHFGSTNRNGSTEDDSGTTPYAVARDNHYHSFDFTNVSGGVLSDSIAYATTDSRPPFSEVIFIEPDTIPASPTNGMVAFYGRSSLPTNWNACNGAASTPNLKDKYLRGASTAADAGATGGALNHQHVIDHTHTAVNHYHDGQSGGDSDQGDRYGDASSSGGGLVTDHHTHNVRLDNVSESGSAYTGAAGILDTVEPRFKRLVAIQNNTGVDDRPRFLIALWLGTIASIPGGWVLCDGVNSSVDMRSYHLKVTDNTSLIGDIGGSNTHAHATSNGHTHVAAGAHGHTGSTSVKTVDRSTGSNPGHGASPQHSHTLSSVSNATSSWSNATIQSDSSNGEPAFKTVVFIEFTGIETTDERMVSISGQLAVLSERNVSIVGVAPAEERYVEILGQDYTTSERKCEISGMIEWVRVPKQVLTPESA